MQKFRACSGILQEIIACFSSLSQEIIAYIWGKFKKTCVCFFDPFQLKQLF